MLLTGGMGRAATMRQSAIGMRAPIATVPGVHSLAEAAARSARSAASSATSLAPPPPPGGPRARSSARAPSSGRGPAPARAGGFLGGLFRQDPAENTRRKYQERVDRVNALEPALAPLDDAALREKTAALRKRAQAGEALDALLPEAFALVREGSKRVLGLRPFDVQLIGGMILNDGQIAEMRTGEGKTLVAVLPSFLNALSARGVHVVTVNDYLARRDSEWVGQVHRFLGLTVGLVQADMSPEDRRASYAADVTYVTNSEIGFDYLRDNLASRREDLVLRAEAPFSFCVIDEVDSILIDEARTPLIISGTAAAPSERYRRASKVASALSRDVHYTVDEKQRNVLLTEEGYEAVEEVLGVRDLYDPRAPWAAFVLNALKAKELFVKDAAYIVRGGEIVIVDEFTGRTMAGRRWSDGLHQAIEAKEGLDVQAESVTLASVSYQAFFRAYPKLAGMTGTAATEVSEFDGIYKLPVAVVPTNRAAARKDSPDVVFRLEEYKWRAVVTEVQRMHAEGRPVLVGTTSVEKSELLSAMLGEEGVPHRVLNAKPENVEKESEIVAQSGRRGAVTLSTNMAGRGTDILLGGNPDFMARLRVREALMPRLVSRVEEEGGEAYKKKRDGKAAAASGGGGGGGGKSNDNAAYAVDPKLYPCDLSDATERLLASAVATATKAWGERSLTLLEAEDRLSVACERGAAEDPATLALRGAFNAAAAEYRAVTESEKAAVQALGGLHVVGTERHESRRIDNQLRGRSGRQGDSGSTRFFLSLEDSLFRVFGGDRIKNLMVAFRVEDLPMESQMLTDALDTAQKRVESYFYDIRKNLFDYDQVVNTQRDRFYSERRRALLSASLDPLMREYAERTVDDILEANVDKDADPGTWRLDALAGKMSQYCPLLEGLTGEELAAQCRGGDFERLRLYLRQLGAAAYEQKVEAVEAVEPGLVAEAQRFFLLTQMDAQWKEHLAAVKFLQQSVGLRGYAQRDPLTEFKLEGFNLFVETLAQIRRNVIYNVYCFVPQRLKREEDGEGGEGGKGAGGRSLAGAGAGAGAAAAKP